MRSFSPCRCPLLPCHTSEIALSFASFSVLLCVTINSSLNLVFSEWDRIFKNPMTTAAAIDRLVHHSVILEFAVTSFRAEKANRTKSNTKTGADDVAHSASPTSQA